MDNQNQFVSQQYVQQPTAVYDPMLPPDPLKETVKSKEARAPFRRTIGRVAGSLLLYLLIDTVVFYLIYFATLIPHISTALHDAAVLQSFGAGDFATGIETFMNVLLQTRSEVSSMNWYMIAVVASGIAASILPMIHVAKKSGFGLFSVITGGKRAGGGLFGKALVIALGASGAWSIIYSILMTLFPSSGVDESTFALEVPTESLLAMILYCVYVTICAPLFEEFIFRGVLLKTLTPYGTTFAVALSALLFGLLHGNLQQIPFAFAVGLVLSYCALKTGNIWTGVAIHFCVNLFSTILSVCIKLYSESTAVMTILSVASIVIYYGGIIGAVALLIIDRKRIRFATSPSEWNHIVLPVRQEQPRAKLFHLLTQIFFMLFILYVAYTVLSSMGRI